VLSNTRGMDADEAAAVTRDICHNLKLALDALSKTGHRINPIMVSRSDSTLRGHYPVETDVIAGELGPFDAHFMVPAFFEGGRITRDSTHYLMVDGKAVPTHETEFARDSVFGYATSYLPGYVAEKTRRRIQAGDVERFLLNDVRGDCHERLRGLSGNVCCVVDAEQQSDLDNFAAQLQEVAGEGKRFLFRSAASLLTSLAKLPPQPVPAEGMAAYVRNGKPGAVIVGSHVKKTSEQLDHLLLHTGAVAVYVDVNRLDRDAEQLRKEVQRQVTNAHESGQSVVIYTSRKERQFPDQKARLAFGERVSAFLMDIVANLPPGIGFLISKGGITSNDVLSTGLGLRASRVLGQILTGCSVVRCPEDHPRYPSLPVVIFPGNVGDETSLSCAYRILAGEAFPDGQRKSARSSPSPTVMSRKLI